MPVQARSDTPLKESLTAATDELRLIAGIGELLQRQLSHILMRASDGEAAQALDALVQHADGLARFVASLREQCSTDWQVCALLAAAELSLSDQKRRLTGEPPAPPPSSEAASGELEFF